MKINGKTVTAADILAMTLGEKSPEADATDFYGLFSSVEPDPVGQILGTGFMRFETPFGMRGLAKWDESAIEFLAFHSTSPGALREIIAQAKKRARRIMVLHDMNPVVSGAMARYGFTPFARTEADGEKITGWEWKEEADFPPRRAQTTLGDRQRRTRPADRPAQSSRRRAEQPGREIRDHGRCQFGQFAPEPDRHCPKPATRRWGDHWFCDEHGRRQNAK